jgi:hypothetical protein
LHELLLVSDVAQILHDVFFVLCTTQLEFCLPYINRYVRGDLKRR